MSPASPHGPVLSSTHILEDSFDRDEVSGLKLCYTYRRCYFSVLISPQKPPDLQEDTSDTFHDSIITDLIDRFNAAGCWTEADKCIDDVDQRIEPIWQEAEDLVKGVAMDLMVTLGERHGVGSFAEDDGHLHLDAYLFPTSFTLQIIPRRSRTDVLQRPDIPPTYPFTREIRITPDQTLMEVSPAEVRVLHIQRAHVLKVCFRNEHYCCKLNVTGSQNSFLQEYNSLQRIAYSDLPKAGNIPRLRGVVVVDDGVIGILLDFIETNFTDLMELLRQSDDVPLLQRQTWESQIRATLEHLHGLNLVWGDAKTSNVLIDRQNKAWVVDFGGGFTKGYIEEAFYDTRAGDWQGFENIVVDLHKGQNCGIVMRDVGRF